MTCEFASSTDNTVRVLSAIQQLLAMNSMNLQRTTNNPGRRNEHPRLDLGAANKNNYKMHLCTGPIVLGITSVFVNTTPQTNV
jgi:hypothetical protein